MAKKKEEDKDYSGLFIPAGIFIGFGVGFIINNVPAGFFSGMGCGFLLMALVKIFGK